MSVHVPLWKRFLVAVAPHLALHAFCLLLMPIAVALHLALHAFCLLMLPIDAAYWCCLSKPPIQCCLSVLSMKVAFLCHPSMLIINNAYWCCKPVYTVQDLIIMSDVSHLLSVNINSRQQSHPLKTDAAAFLFPEAIHIYMLFCTAY